MRPLAGTGCARHGKTILKCGGPGVEHHSFMRLADEGDQLRRPISCPQISAFDAGAIGVSPQVTVAAVALGVVVDCQRGGGARDRVAGAFEQLGHFAGILNHTVDKPVFPADSRVFGIRFRKPVLVAVGVELNLQPELPEIVLTAGGPGPFPRLVQRRQQHRGQNCDDRDDNQKLDQGEAETHNMYYVTHFVPLFHFSSFPVFPFPVCSVRHG